MAASQSRGPLKRALGLLSRGKRLISGRFRADPYTNYTVASINLGGGPGPGPFSGCPYNKSPSLGWI